MAELKALNVKIDEGFATLRDQFAMAAIPVWVDDDPAKMAEWAYRLADAMLKERAK